MVLPSITEYYLGQDTPIGASMQKTDAATLLLASATSLSLSACSLPERRAGAIQRSQNDTSICATNAEDFQILTQLKPVGCTPAGIASVVNFLLGVDKDSPDALTVKQVAERLAKDDFRNIMYGDYGSEKALSKYFNEVLPNEERINLPYVLVFKTATCVEDYVRDLKQSGAPLLFGYMYDVMAPWQANIGNSLLCVFPEALASKFASGDPYMYGRYLHLGILLCVEGDEVGSRKFILANPWGGIPFVSKASPGVEELLEDDFKSRVFVYENPKIGNPVARRYWEEHMGPVMHHLVAPGRYGVFEKK